MILLPDESYFHSPLKGCNTYDIERSYSRRINAYTKRWCKTHQVIIGRSGWALGFWGGTESVTDHDRQERRKYSAQKAGRASAEKRH